MSTLTRYGNDLWGLIWPNVETQEQIKDRAVGQIPSDTFAPFPWRWDAAKLPDDISPDNRHPCTIYWVTPRRIKLKIEKSNTAICDLSGEPATDRVSAHEYLSGGSRFTGWGGHPLSATKRKKTKNGEIKISTVSCPIERIGMQHWLGLVQDSDGTVSPAPCVSNARLRRRVGEDARLVVHGYAVKAATVLAWHAAEMPFFTVEDNDLNDELKQLTVQLVDATERASKTVAAAVKIAQGVSRAKKARKKYINRLANDAPGMLWRDMESDFFAALAEVADGVDMDADDPTRAIRVRFYKQLRKAAYGVVDDTCPDELLHPRDVVAAHRKLRRALCGRAIVTSLGLPMPKKTKIKKAAAT